MKYENVLGAIGKTPLIKLNKIPAADGACRLYVKAEFMNPGGSIKDRAALNMLQSAMENGVLDRDTVIIEPTSGNTGIGLAMACAVYGLRLVLTMPDNMSAERQKLLSAYGAQIVLTPACLGMQGAVDEANRLAKDEHSAFIPSQFENADNAMAHYLTTAPEIFEDLPQARAVVAGIGTGGTAMGIADFVIENGIDCAVIGVEPSESPLLTSGHAGAHGIQGIGANFVPQLLDIKKLNAVVLADTAESIAYARRLATEEGLLVGISAGAAVAAAVKISEKIDGDIVIILPDTGTRYLSTELYE